MSDESFEMPTAEPVQDTAPAPEAMPDEAMADDAAPAEAPRGDDGEAPARPREVIKGIHPELVCTCEECDPEFTELQWFSVDEARKTKGTAMLFCAYTGRKYFSPVPELQAFLTANPTKGRR